MKVRYKRERSTAGLCFCRILCNDYTFTIQIARSYGMADCIISACKNQARNYMRDKNRHAEYSIDEYLDTPNPHDGADEIEMRLAYTDELEHLSKVWPKLDGRSRYLLESHYILEKSPYEIAANLGIKPDSVRMALTRARKAAYALLAKE